MTNYMAPSPYILDAAIALLAVMGFAAAAFMPGIGRWSRGVFISFYSMQLLLSCVFAIDSLAYTMKILSLEKAAVFLEYLLPSIPLLTLNAYLLHTCKENWRQHAFFRVSAALESVFLILLIVSVFTDRFYYFDAAGEFYRGPWHTLMMMPLSAGMLLNLAFVIHWRKRLSQRYFYAFLVFLVPFMIISLIHMISYNILLIGFGFCISSFIMFFIILVEQIDQFMRQQQEIARQRASIMILQMRPHFIYNTMTSIYYLCEQDPRKAQQVTLDFTTYLRKNFTAIASEKTIPFSEELEHTRSYLAVEQVQFEDSLFVEYDIPHTRFSLPPLTLQPIVENAVKHGMDPDSEPLHIFVRTRETDSGSVITVEDTGSGFEPTDDSEPHIALNNIRQRLEMMCRGKLTITPREGGGTVVKVTIP